MNVETTLCASWVFFICLNEKLGETHMVENLFLKINDNCSDIIFPMKLGKICKDKFEVITEILEQKLNSFSLKLTSFIGLSSFSISH